MTSPIAVQGYLSSRFSFCTSSHRFYWVFKVFTMNVPSLSDSGAASLAHDKDRAIDWEDKAAHSVNSSRNPPQYHVDIFLSQSLTVQRVLV